MTSTSDEHVKALLLAQEQMDWICVEDVQGSRIDVRVDVKNPDGTYAAFLIFIEVCDENLKAFKRPEETKLPVGCFDRHIMHDGYFCLGWEGDAEFTNSPSTKEERVRWWQQLGGFLLLQQEANLCGFWRRDCGWKHSSMMAQLQQKVERMEAQLPSVLRQLLKNEEIHLMPVRETSRERTHTKIQHRRRACPCGSTKQLIHCHEHVLVEIIRTNRELETQQRNWLRDRVREGVTCCGTLKRCELKRVQKELIDE